MSIEAGAEWSGVGAISASVAQTPESVATLSGHSAEAMALALLSDARNAVGRSPLMLTLLCSAAQDVVAGGPTATVLAPCGQDGRGMPGLKLGAVLHQLVLEGRGGPLTHHFPSVGGTVDVDRLWPDARAVLTEHRDELTALVASGSVQTNEAGRMAPLLGGLQIAATRAGAAAGLDGPMPVRLLEIGASGGLNLRPDMVAVSGTDGVVVGDPHSPLRLVDAWSGPVPSEVHPDVRLDVVSRAGCDQAPLDVSDVEDRRMLASFVWGDDTARWERLQAAFALADAEPVTVQAANGAEWIEQQLETLPTGALTVVWHSIVWQYVSADQRARGLSAVMDAAARSTPQAPLAVLVFEPRRTGAAYSFDLVLRQWPGDGALQHLGSGTGHGIPFTWRS